MPRAQASGILFPMSPMDDLGEQHVDRYERVTLNPYWWVSKRGAGGAPTLDDHFQFPGQLVGRSIDCLRRPTVPGKKPLPLARLALGEDIGLVDPDLSSAEVLGFECADPDPAADLLDRDAGDVGGLGEEPANSRPAGIVLALDPVRHRKSPRNLTCSLTACLPSNLPSATS